MSPGVNNTITVKYEDDGTTEKIKLVTTVRGDSLEGLISIESPLGKAILGHKAGDRVEVVVNSNVSYFIDIAAAFVNVITNIEDGSILCILISLSILLIITVVLPEPGPASTSAGPSL